MLHGIQLKLQPLGHWQSCEPRESGHICTPFCGCVGTFDQKGLVYAGRVSDKWVGELRVTWCRMKICQILRSPPCLYMTCVVREWRPGKENKSEEEWIQKKRLMKARFTQQIMYLMILFIICFVLIRIQTNMLWHQEGKCESQYKATV